MRFDRNRLGTRCDSFRRTEGFVTPQLIVSQAFGGEGGIRNLDVFNIFNILQKHRVQIVSNGTLVPAHHAQPQ
jgi:hypothetical protein